MHKLFSLLLFFRSKKTKIQKRERKGDREQHKHKKSENIFDIYMESWKLKMQLYLSN